MTPHRRYGALGPRYHGCGHGGADAAGQRLYYGDYGEGGEEGPAGDPGELKGDFTVQRDVGTVTVNSNEGIFGTVEDAGFISGEAVSVAEPEEVHAGEASILCTISGSDTRAYEVEILRVNPEAGTAGILLRVTDPEPLETTGGIVQG